MKPFSRIEMKMLIFNKVKRGMTYDDAVKQLSEELKQMNTFAKSSAKRVEGEVADFSYPSTTPSNLKLQKGGKNGNDERLRRRNILPC